MFDFTVKYKSNHQELHHWCFWDNIPKLLEGILKKRNMTEQDQKPKKGRKKVFHWIEILSLNLIAISIKAFSDLSHIFWDALPLLSPPFAFFQHNYQHINITQPTWFFSSSFYRLLSPKLSCNAIYIEDFVKTSKYLYCRRFRKDIEIFVRKNMFLIFI